MHFLSYSYSFYLDPIVPITDPQAQSAINLTLRRSWIPGTIHIKRLIRIDQMFILSHNYFHFEFRLTNFVKLVLVLVLISTFSLNYLHWYLSSIIQYL